MTMFSDMNGQEDLVEGFLNVPAGSWVRVVGPDPARWMIAFSVPTTSVNVTTVPGGAGTNNQGAIVQPGVRPTEFVYRDWGEFVKGEWWVKCFAGTSALTYWTARLRN